MSEKKEKAIGKMARGRDWVWVTRVAIWGTLALCLSDAWGTPRVAPVSVVVPDGASAWVAITLASQDAGAPVCSVRFTVEAQGGAIMAWEPGAAVEQAGKGAACRVLSPGACLCVVYGGPDGLPEGDLVRVLVRPAGDTCEVRVREPEGAGPDAAEKAVEAGERGLVSRGGGAHVPHKADRNGDWQISLSELLRVVQFYNLGQYSCRDGSEDGYWPGEGDRACAPHDADYAPQDWRISLSEALRVVQFFNAALLP